MSAFINTLITLETATGNTKISLTPLKKTYTTFTKQKKTTKPLSMRFFQN